MAYNTSHTRRKSTQLFDLDCRTTGSVKTSVETLEGAWSGIGVVTTDEAIEAGECIAMVRVPRGVTITGGFLAWDAGNTAAGSVAVGVGDPFCCGRLIGAVNISLASGNASQLPEGTNTSCNSAFVLKTGDVGDGCGLGYTYRCETDVVVTIGYGADGFSRGGGRAATGPVSGPWGGVALPSGSRLFLRLDGIRNAVPGSNLS